jgi:hypothetical protein
MICKNMPFSPTVKEEVLIKSKRSCCICNEFCGLYSYVHHIVQEADGGPNTIENAIVLCDRCHGEARHYNVHHPIGNKYSVEELKKQRDKWWEWCDKNPLVPPPKHPISIKPSTIFLGSGKWKVDRAIQIHNRTNEILYQVWTKFIFDTKEVTPDDIEIKILNMKEQLELETGKAVISGDIFNIIGVDERGNNSLYLQISSINPNEVISIRLKNKLNKELSSAKNHILYPVILRFSNEPEYTGTSDNGEIQINFTPPENLRLKSFGVLIKKKTN